MKKTRTKRSPRYRTPFLTGVLLLTLLSGCTLFRSAFAPEPLPLLDPNSFDPPVSLRQRITISYGEREFPFQAIVEVHNDRMVVVGLSSYSTTLFTIRVQSGNIEVDAERDVPFNLKRFVTDLQWSIWPEVPGFNRFKVEENKEGDGLVRKIFRDGELVATVNIRNRPPWKGNVRFMNPHGYDMRIEPLSVDRMTPNQ